MTRNQLTRPSARRARFIRCEAGSLSLEITVVLPTLFMILILAYASFDVFKVNSQSAKIGYAINDIVSRYETISDTEIAELYALQSKMFPFYMKDVKMRISSICYEDNTYQVMWSDVRQPDYGPLFDENGDEVEPTSALWKEQGVLYVEPLTDDRIPLSLMPTMAPQTTVLLTEISATYTPIFGFFPEQELSTNLTIRPRLVNFVPHEQLNGGLVCPAVDDGEEEEVVALAEGQPLEEGDEIDGDAPDVEPLADASATVDGPSTQ